MKGMNYIWSKPFKRVCWVVIFTLLSLLAKMKTLHKTEIDYGVVYLDLVVELNTFNLMFLSFISEIMLADRNSDFYAAFSGAVKSLVLIVISIRCPLMYCSLCRISVGY